MPGAAAPNGTVTFLFTDIEASTERWDRLPDQMRAAVGVHDALLSEVFDRHDGYVFTTAGDSFAVAFSDARTAVEAAIEVQTTLAGRTFGPIGELRVRIGIHTGTAELRGGDYFGIDVNIAARVMSAGHGGQVLATEPVLILSRSDSVDLGTHLLAGIESPQRIHQISATGLEIDFPPLRVATGVSTNVPAPADEFIGRTDDLALVHELLDQHRLVTLLGTGGVGKTRMSIEVARERSAKDGTWFVDLAPVTTAEGIAASVADAVGMKETPGRPLGEQLFDHLGDKEMVIVLDNCEQIVDEAADFVIDALARCPGVTALATSREALEVPGECVKPVGPLPVPRDHDHAEAVLRSPAVRLLALRAGAARPGFDVVGEDPDAAIRICQLTDGLPLAIELAAARVRTYTLGELAEVLAERLSVLDARRGRDRRHRTLGAVVEWSYELLEPDERRAFAMLSVFIGGFTTVSASAVMAGSNPGSTAEVIERLVEKSLVAADQQGVGHTRFRMLEPLRRFSLEVAGEFDSRVRADLSHRHLRWVLDEVATLEAAMRTSEQDSALLAARSDHDNLRAARAHAIEIGDFISALRITTSAPIDGFETRLHLLDELLTKAPEAPDDLRARASYTAAGALFESGRFAEALAFADEATERFAALDDRSQHAYSQMMVAFCRWGAGRDGVEPLLTEAMRTFDELDDDMGRAYLNWVHSQWIGRDDPSNPKALVEASLAIELFASIDASYGECHAHEGLGYILAGAGDYVAAMSEMTTALRRLDDLGHLGCVAHVLDGVAAVLVRSDRVDAAAEVLGAADRFREVSGAAERPWEIEARAECVAALERVLDESTLRHHKARGRTLGVAEVLDLAGAHAENALESEDRATEL